MYRTFWSQRKSFCFKETWRYLCCQPLQDL